jgi:type IV secretory pathway component VirB8
MSKDDFNETRQLYLEKYGDAVVTSNYLRIAVALLCLAVLGLAVLNLRTIRTFQNFRPLVIRIDELGRAQAVDYKSLEYHPGDREAKYFLSEFCQLYFRRNRYTIHDDFTKSLYFLDGKVANDIMEQYRKDDTINAFLNNPIWRRDHRASVDFYLVEYAPADHSVLKRTLYTANFLFVFKDQVPNELIPVNPLGLTISYFRQDQAFTSEGQK